MDKYTEELRCLLKKAEIETVKYNSNIVSTGYFLLTILSSNNEISKLLNNFNITYNKIKNNIKANNSSNNFISYDNNFKVNIEKAFINLREKNIDELNTINLVLAIFSDKNSEFFNIVKNRTQNTDLIYKKLTKLNMINNGLLINEIGINLNELVLNKDLNKTYNRENELNHIIEILARKNKNNPLLIGEAGVGKTAIIEELARRINNKDVPDFLLNKKIISLNISSVIAGTKYRGEFEEKLGKIIKELEFTNNLIMFVDEVHTLIGAGGAEGAIDASNILKPVLARNNIKVIGATTINEYKKYIEKDKAFDRRFQKIIIKEPNEKETINILLKIKKDYEKFHNVKISNDIVKDIVLLSNKYIKDKKEPDKSIDILDEVCAYSRINNLTSKKNISELKKIDALKKRYIKNKDFKNALIISEKQKTIKRKNYNKNDEVSYDNLKTVLSNKTNQIIYELDSSDNNLYKLKKFIIGQDENIEELSKINNIVKKKKNIKPLSIFISGSSGTGKTECVKKYAEILGLNFIRLDMSEYNNEMSINRILGSVPGYVGYDDNNGAFESLKFYPNSVILLDEIDKANTKIINLLFSILDEGKIKNNKNEDIYFNNSIIFLTSNVMNNKNNIGFKNLKSKSNLFSKEFINRINYFIEFNNLNINDIKKIINLKIKEICTEYNEKIHFSHNEIENIIKESEYEIYGARKIYNIIKKHVEYKLIKI